SGRVAQTVLDTARQLGVEHVVVGESPNPMVRSRLRRGLIDRLITELPDVNVHVFARTQGRGSTQPIIAERPDSEALLRALHASASRAGLRVYLGYARGTGTTLAMLDEACRRKGRGTDVVVAAINTEQRPACDTALQPLEILGGRNSPAMRGHVDV